MSENPPVDATIVSGERRHAVRQQPPGAGARDNWQVRVEASPLSDSWKAAVDLSGGDSCIGVLTVSGAVRRGTVLSSGCSQSDLTFIDIEALRGWLDNLVEMDRDGGDLIMVDPTEVAEVANLPWLKHLSALAAGRIDVPNEGVFWMLIGWRKTTEKDAIDRRRLRLALRVLAQCAGSHVATIRRERRMRILEGMMDELAPAFILVNNEARVFWTNYRAELVLAQRNFLVRNGGNMLASSTQTKTQMLREEIAKVSRTDPEVTGNADSFLLLPRSGEDDDLVVLRAVAGRHGLEGNRAVLVIVPQHDTSEMASKLISAFGLIPSEARLVGALIADGSSAAAAARVGITEQSAKTYLKRIYAKLGISSQLELGMLVASMMPPLRGGMPRPTDAHQMTNF
ncbi:helix-turn-helix transcriptional regulator [Sphingobium boeckii]|uniref:DNA-binding CsgD family transcriptional regulator n=1 Tax=Sphingobium boeckii TaxID=1082345 RepID=A0A7W9EF85_9SPHN|nr:hypothetical protein [Sphingobium boeckii]MBB5685461.1 DNA-binding CsgD family transcriptional regulator [Sphingobium boeckii]